MNRAIDFADMYEEASVLGVDLSPSKYRSCLSFNFVFFLLSQFLEEYQLIVSKFNQRSSHRTSIFKSMT